MGNSYSTIWPLNNIVSFVHETGIPFVIPRSMKDLLKNDVEARQFFDNFNVAVKEQLQKQSLVIIPLKTTKPPVRIVKFRVVHEKHTSKRNGYRCIALVDDINQIIFILDIYTHKQKNNFSKAEKDNYRKIGKFYLALVK